MKIRVYYEDTDAAGIVYYANYLKYCERARSEVFFEAGETPQSASGYFVVKELEAKYLSPASLGDILTIETELLEKRSASIVLLQRVKKEASLLFEMKIKLAYLHQGRPVKIPEKIYRLVSAWESGE
ncbi:YbgC/FadM family acyl-CoA thioesterase [Hydrogenimonas urashimensis]|uniref:YbgC/FadM family acyl-CoA thioesterase n=1 Tax=Hydrogenimonas urashimensis TaxID=2740515 RepID=UPI0019151626|nr:YbgC/FadM family acyl-CoA thioesterase [Hydrogenimonas urashimensis]